jgi:hypothetical protein
MIQGERPGAKDRPERSPASQPGDLCPGSGLLLHFEEQHDPADYVHGILSFRFPPGEHAARLPNQRAWREIVLICNPRRATDI